MYRCIDVNLQLKVCESLDLHLHSTVLPHGAGSLFLVLLVLWHFWYYIQTPETLDSCFILKLDLTSTYTWGLLLLGVFAS